MRHIRNKTKTNKRVKRVKTNKRNTRKQTFRKSRRVNRGGDPDMEPPSKRIRPNSNDMASKILNNKENIDKHVIEQTEHHRKQDEKNVDKMIANMKNGTYLSPLVAKPGDTNVDQTEELANSARQQQINDKIDEAERNPNNDHWFGGKKKRAKPRK